MKSTQCFAVNATMHILFVDKIQILTLHCEITQNSVLNKEQYYMDMDLF